MNKIASSDFKPLKIGLFIASDPSEPGGIQEYVFRLMEQFETLGHVVTVYGPKPAKKTIYPFTRYTPVSQNLYLNLSNGFQPTVNYPLFQNTEINEDIIHIHEPYVPFITGNFPFTTFAKIKVAGFHTAWDNPDSFDPWISFVTHSIPLLKHLYSSYYDGVVYCSKFVEKRWQVMFDSKLSSKIIPYGVNQRFVCRQKPKKLSVLFLARLVPRKGVLDFVQAIALLPKNLTSNVSFSIVGIGPELPKACLLAKQLKIERTVKFCGEKTGEAKWDFFRKATIFVAPYINEGFGLTLLEAAASGCIIIGYKNKSFTDFMKLFPSKKLFTPKGDIKLLAKNLALTLKNYRLRKYSQTLGKKISREHSWKNTAEKTLRFYYSLIKMKSAI